MSEAGFVFGLLLLLGFELVDSRVAQLKNTLSFPGRLRQDAALLVEPVRVLFLRFELVHQQLHELLLSLVKALVRCRHHIRFSKRVC